MATNKRPEDIFLAHGGQLRMSEAMQLGLSRYMLYSLRDRGVIEQISRGLYRLADLPPISNPDLVTVSLRFPNAVICLVSALAFHKMTTQIPHSVSIAVPRESRPPVLDYPPLQVYRYATDTYRAGIGEHQLDGINVRIYTPEKTLADCFKFRNRIGMDVVLEALKLYKTRNRINHRALIEYARLCRVEKVMRPYLEALT
jgi:predicted transcriptional regulator of viral defense system